VTEVIIIFNKNGEILDFSPRNIDIEKITKNLKEEEIYDDGEMIRVRAII
jgi:hypothetical protein